jgi:hypothetical protein
MDTPWLLYLAVAGFMCGILYTLISVSRASNTAGKKDMTSSITTIAMVNGALCLTLAGIGYFSVNSIQILKRPYIVILLHATLIFAIIGFCVSTLRQLGIDPTTLKPSSSSESGSASSDSDSADLTTAIGLGSAGFGLGLVSIGVLIYLYRAGKFS